MRYAGYVLYIIGTAFVFGFGSLFLTYPLPELVAASGQIVAVACGGVVGYRQARKNEAAKAGNVARPGEPVT